MQILSILCCLIGLLTCGSVFLSAIRPAFRTFEDYLQHLDKNLQTSIVRLAPEVRRPLDGATQADAGQNAFTNSIGTGIAVDLVVEEEKNNVTCCILGEIAGDKGFHCFAEFYAARIQLRNMNRAHNRKLGFYGRGQLPHYGERLMKTFEQCVAGHGLVFHRCCHLATLERREIDLRGAGGSRVTSGSATGNRDQKLGGIDGRFRKSSMEESVSDSMSDQDSSSAAGAASASSSSMED